jgi:hypothetical protein
MTVFEILPCKLAFFFKGINPRTWREKTKAKRASIIYAEVWIVTLGLLVLTIYTRSVALG